MSSPRSGPSKGVCACYSDILTANQQFFGERYADAYGPKTRLSPSAAHFREEWRLRNPPIPRWSVFGRASEGTIGPVHFGWVRKIGRARLLSVHVSFSTLAGELVLQSPSAVAEDL